MLAQIVGLFEISPEAKNYRLISIDHKTNWPNAMFLRKSNAVNVIESLNAYIAEFGIPKQKRTDPALKFRGEKC